MATSLPDDIVGEIIAASTTEFTARSPQVNEPPPFGSFVRVCSPLREPVEDADPFASAPPDGTYGLVCESVTASLDPNRRPAAFGAADEEQLRMQQPQIFALLVTDFKCRVVAHVEHGKVRHYLPDRPPRLHARVVRCTPSETRHLTERLDFLRTLALVPTVPSAEELIAACLRRSAACHPDAEGFLERAAKELVLVLSDDVPRLTAIMRKLH
ncbi:MAG: hypothetical protein ACP5VE_09810 [Chthonomonadales bacterium]